MPNHKVDQPPAYAPRHPPQQSGYPPQQPDHEAGGMNPNYPRTTQPGYPGVPPPTRQPYYPPTSGQQNSTAAVHDRPNFSFRSSRVVHQEMTFGGGEFNESPMNSTCPQCRQNVVTETSYQKGTMTYCVCGVLALVGCCLGCCLIPFCVDSCKDVKHSCPNCNTSIKIYRRM